MVHFQPGFLSEILADPRGCVFPVKVQRVKYVKSWLITHNAMDRQDDLTQLSVAQLRFMWIITQW